MPVILSQFLDNLYNDYHVNNSQQNHWVKIKDLFLDNIGQVL